MHGAITQGDLEGLQFTGLMSSFQAFKSPLTPLCQRGELINVIGTAVIVKTNA